MDHSGRRPFLVRNAGIAAAIGAISVVGTALSLAMPLLSIVMAERGLSSSVIGLNTTVGGIAALLCTPFVPALARTVGPTLLLLLGVAGAAIIFPLYYFFDSLTVWFALRFALGICLNVAFVLSEFWINALAPPERRGLVLGIYGTVLSMGFAVGPLILSLIGSSGFLPFGVGTGLLVLAAVPVLIGLFADPPSVEGEAHHFMHYLAVVPMATFAALAMGAVESSVMSLSAVYGLGLGYSEHVAALLVASVAIGNICSQVPLGLLADRMDRRVLLACIAFVGVVLAPVVVLVSSSLIPLIIVMAVWGGTAAGLYSVGLTHLGARLSGVELASANAAFLFMYSTGMLCGPALTGAGMDVIGKHGFVVVPALFLLAYGLFAVRRIARMR